MVCLLHSGKEVSTESRGKAHGGGEGGAEGGYKGSGS